MSARVYLHWMSPQFISPRLTTISSTPPRLRTGGGGLSRERLSSHARSFYYLPKPPTLPGRARGACPSVARPRAFLARRKLVPLRVGGTRKRINPEHISNVSRRAPVNLICFRAREQLKHTCTGALFFGITVAERSVLDTPRELQITDANAHVRARPGTVRGVCASSARV